MPLSRRTLLVAALAAAVGCTTRNESAAPAAAGAQPSAGGLGGLPLAPRPKTSVAMIGDSITEGSEEDLRSTFESAGFTDVRIDGEASRRIEVGDGTGSPLSGIRTLYQMLADGADPDVWVIALGTNDVGQYATAEEYGELVDQIVGMLPADRPLVWVDVYRPGKVAQTAMFNEVVAGRMSDRGHAQVARWWPVASDAGQQVLRSDDLHPNRRGRAVFASLVVATALATT